MPRPANDVEVSLSVFDRLIDLDPYTSSEEYRTRAQSLRDLRASVRRDLEWLLNTRQIAVPPDEGLKELNRSLYVYGLPDFTSKSVADARQQHELLRSVQSLVKMFEPRLMNVRVATLESNDLRSRTMRFRIEGLLRIDPAPEHISFDTTLELTSGQYQVKGEVG